MFRQLMTITIALLAAATVAKAAPLATAFTYQGELQTSGTPATGNFDFEFELFDDQASGASLGFVTVDDATVTDGVFTVELDFGTTPFAGDQLWLEINVRDGADTGDYTGLTPRQKLTATPYALHAEMVAVDAVTGTEIADNSVQADDLAPASVGSSEIIASQVQRRVSGSCVAGSFVTAVNQDGSVGCDPDIGGLDQAGAVAAMGGLADSNPLNHDRYSNSDAIGAMGAVDDGNPLNHDRFSNSDAIGAMGALANSNPLNHTRYSDASAVAAILAADGSGSTLDADLLDGQSASEIIGAASNAVRTPISDADLPLTISQPGSYYFVEDLSHGDATTDAILVNTDNVTIDLMGFTLFGPGQDSGTGNHGINIRARKNITIRNGTIREFGNGGIYNNNSGGRSTRVINVTTSNNGGVGIYVWATGVIVLGCHANDNDGLGIHTGPVAVVKDSTATGNGNIGILTNDHSTVINNVARENGGAGITVQNGAVVIGNSASQNGDGGIRTGGGGTLINNTAFRNEGLAGLVASNGSTIRGNSAYFNEQWGILVGGDVLIEGNVIHNNNTSDAAFIGGLSVLADSRVVGNTVTQNEQYNIYVSSVDNVLDRNHVTDATDVLAANRGVGIYFVSNDNLFRENTATGNLINFGGNVPPASRDIDNIDW